MPDERAHVEWSHQAEQRLREMLAARSSAAHRAGRDPQQLIAKQRKQLDKLLRRSFPQAQTILVQDQMAGFRKLAGLLRFVLRVEVKDGARSGSYVVKIGPQEKLQKEWDAWESCRPYAFRGDPVFLPLEIGLLDDPPQSEALGALIYGDAHQFLAVDQVRSLEEALTDAVLYDLPQLKSVGIVLWELYERLAHMLYRRSFAELPPADGRDENGKAWQWRVHRLAESMQAWQLGIPAELRRCVNLSINIGPEQFIDPVDYLAYVNQFVPLHVEPAEAGQTAAKLSPILSDGQSLAIDSSLRPLPAQVVPQMLRGCSHGDLHGRNVLVGQVRGKALWPTLFDYEDMSPDNLIGWDFVKLETELKIRLYDQLYDGSESHLAACVQQFELRLAKATESCYQRLTPWPSITGHERREERLLQVLLEIRHRAAVHLGLTPQPSREHCWLEEYYFLLTCYGVCTGRFENQTRRERIGACVSAGVAAARLSWPRAFHRKTGTQMT